jgi:hypothetical protein
MGGCDVVGVVVILVDFIGERTAVSGKFGVRSTVIAQIYFVWYPRIDEQKAFDERCG